MYHFEEHGWCKGEVVEPLDDEELLDGEEVANFMIYYEADDTEVPHHLSILDYSPNPDAS